MHWHLLLILVTLSALQADDFRINNQQLCTQRPFNVNFRHNCSRTRLVKDAGQNVDQVLHIAILFAQANSSLTTISLSNSSQHVQKVYLTFITPEGGRYISINNRKPMPLNDLAVSPFLYDFRDGSVTPLSPSSMRSGIGYGADRCKPKSLEPEFAAWNSSRIYYLATGVSDLRIDFSSTSRRIPPLLVYFHDCYGWQSTLSALAIFLIVLISALALITAVLVLFCLKKQVKQLYHILRNFLNRRRGLTPKIHIDAQAPL